MGGFHVFFAKYIMMLQASHFNTLAHLGAALYLAHQVVDGHITVGQFTIYVGGISSSIAIVADLLSWMGDVSIGSAALLKIAEVLNLPDPVEGAMLMRKSSQREPSTIDKKGALPGVSLAE